jgi:ATP-dependent helicase/nuclease subunit B
VPVRSLSASAYQDLRTCPYRFFALRQLGLRERSEIDVELAKSDVGLWLHEVLQQFHEADPGADAQARRQALDEASAAASARLGLEPADLLPYRADWPALRDGYLEWLTAHEARGWRYERGEVPVERVLPRVTLQGRLDRVDQGPQVAHMVIDYKTESLDKTKGRIKDPMEDTQLAFYAALMPEPGLRAAYVNVSDREGTSAHEQAHLDALRDALLAGLQGELDRIAEGAPLPALGAGSACDYCGARGLCRRDFWGEAA